jgi:hypothetical protein
MIRRFAAEISGFPSDQGVQPVSFGILTVKLSPCPKKAQIRRVQSRPRFFEFPVKFPVLREFRPAKITAEFRNLRRTDRALNNGEGT